MGALIASVSIVIVWQFVRIFIVYRISQSTYDLALKLTDEEHQPLTNMPFYLFNARNNKPIVDKQDNPVVFLSDNKGQVTASNIPGAKYTLENKEENLKLLLYINNTKQKYFTVKTKKNHPKWKAIKKDSDQLIFMKNY